MISPAKVIKERLEQLCPSVEFFQVVRSFKEVPEDVSKLPALYVIDIGEEGQEPQHLNSKRQLFNAVVVVHVLAPPELIDQVKIDLDKLRGFLPDGANTAVWQIKREPIDERVKLVWDGYMFGFSYYE